ncbi:MAG: hypothetical protein ACYCZT_13080 [Thiobacillus sp.]
MSSDVAVVFYSGVFGLIGVIVGAAASICGSWLAMKAQEKQLKRQIQANAIEAEVTAFRDAIVAVLDQLFIVHESKRTNSQDILLKDVYELDRRVHRLALFGSLELITASGRLQNAVGEFVSGGPLIDAKDPRNTALYKARTVWLTRARKELQELRGLTLDHISNVKESVQMLNAQMDVLAEHLEHNKALQPTPSPSWLGRG